MNYHTSILFDGRTSSTYWGTREADTAEQAVTQMINENPHENSAAAMAQREGCIVIVGPAAADGHDGYAPYLLELFYVGPDPAAERRAMVLRRVPLPPVMKRKP